MFHLSPSFPLSSAWPESDVNRLKDQFLSSMFKQMRESPESSRNIHDWIDDSSEPSTHSSWWIQKDGLILRVPSKKHGEWTSALFSSLSSPSSPSPTSLPQSFGSDFFELTALHSTLSSSDLVNPFHTFNHVHYDILTPSFVTRDPILDDLYFAFPTDGIQSQLLLRVENLLATVPLYKEDSRLHSSEQGPFAFKEGVEEEDVNPHLSHFHPTTQRRIQNLALDFLVHYLWPSILVVREFYTDLLASMECEFYESMLRAFEDHCREKEQFLTRKFGEDDHHHHQHHENRRFDFLKEDIFFPFVLDDTHGKGISKMMLSLGFSNVSENHVNFQWRLQFPELRTTVHTVFANQCLIGARLQKPIAQIPPNFYSAFVEMEQRMQHTISVTHSSTSLSSDASIEPTSIVLTYPFTSGSRISWISRENLLNEFEGQSELLDRNHRVLQQIRRATKAKARHSTRESQISLRKTENNILRQKRPKRPAQRSNSVHSTTTTTTTTTKTGSPTSINSLSTVPSLEKYSCADAHNPNQWIRIQRDVVDLQYCRGVGKLIPFPSLGQSRCICPHLPTSHPKVMEFLHYDVPLTLYGLPPKTTAHAPAANTSTTTSFILPFQEASKRGLSLSTSFVVPPPMGTSMTFSRNHRNLSIFLSHSMRSVSTSHITTLHSQMKQTEGIVRSLWMPNFQPSSSSSPPPPPPQSLVLQSQGPERPKEEVHVEDILTLREAFTEKQRLQHQNSQLEQLQLSPKTAKRQLRLAELGRRKKQRNNIKTTQHQHDFSPAMIDPSLFAEFHPYPIPFRPEDSTCDLESDHDVFCKFQENPECSSDPLFLPPSIFSALANNISLSSHQQQPSLSLPTPCSFLQTYYENLSEAMHGKDHLKSLFYKDLKCSTCDDRGFVKPENLSSDASLCSTLLPFGNVYSLDVLTETTDATTTAPLYSVHHHTRSETRDDRFALILDASSCMLRMGCTREFLGLNKISDPEVLKTYLQKSNPFRTSWNLTLATHSDIITSEVRQNGPRWVPFPLRDRIPLLQVFAELTQNRKHWVRLEEQKLYGRKEVISLKFAFMYQFGWISDSANVLIQHQQPRQQDHQQPNRDGELLPSVPMPSSPSFTSSSDSFLSSLSSDSNCSTSSSSCSSVASTIENPLSSISSSQTTISTNDCSFSACTSNQILSSKAKIYRPPDVSVPVSQPTTTTTTTTTTSSSLLSERFTRIFTVPLHLKRATPTFSSSSSSVIPPIPMGPPPQQQSTNIDLTKDPPTHVLRCTPDNCYQSLFRILQVFLQTKVQDIHWKTQGFRDMGERSRKQSIGKQLKEEVRRAQQDGKTMDSVFWKRWLTFQKSFLEDHHSVNDIPSPSTSNSLLQLPKTMASWEFEEFYVVGIFVSKSEKSFMFLPTRITGIVRKVSPTTSSVGLNILPLDSCRVDFQLFDDTTLQQKLPAAKLADPKNETPFVKFFQDYIPYEGFISCCEFQKGLTRNVEKEIVKRFVPSDELDKGNMSCHWSSHTSSDPAVEHFYFQPGQFTELVRDLHSAIKKLVKEEKNEVVIANLFPIHLVNILLSSKK